MYTIPSIGRGAAHSAPLKVKYQRLQQTSQPVIRELTNRRLLHDDAVRLRDMLTAHASLSTCQRLAKVDDAIESDLPAS